MADWSDLTFAPLTTDYIAHLRALRDRSEAVATDLESVQEGKFFRATSTSQVIIATGSHTLALAESDRAFGVGSRVRIADAANPGSQYMIGTVTAYADPDLTVDVDTVAGGGATVSDWSVTLATLAPEATALDPGTATADQALAVSGDGASVEGRDVLFGVADDPSPQLGGALNGQGEEITDTIHRGHREAVRDHGVIDAADTDAVATSQTVGSGGGDLVLDGVKVSNGAASFSSPRQITVTSANDLSGVTVTIGGTAPDGSQQSKSLAGPNAGTVATTAYFGSVDTVSVDAAASGIEVGQGDASLLIDWGYGVQVLAVGAAITAIFTVGSSGSANWSTVLRLTNGASYGWPSSPSGIYTPGGDALADLVTSTAASDEDEWIIQTPDAGTTVFIASGPQEYQAAS
jgi:hypothetical protein